MTNYYLGDLDTDEVRDIIMKDFKDHPKASLLLRTTRAADYGKDLIALNNGSSLDKLAWDFAMWRINKKYG